MPMIRTGINLVEKGRWKNEKVTIQVGKYQLKLESFQCSIK